MVLAFWPFDPSFSLYMGGNPNPLDAFQIKLILAKKKKTVIGKRSEVLEGGQRQENNRGKSYPSSYLDDKIRKRKVLCPYIQMYVTVCIVFLVMSSPQRRATLDPTSQVHGKPRYLQLIHKARVSYKPRRCQHELSTRP